MAEVTFTFMTQQQANDAVLALSIGYKVEQWFNAISATVKPYCVRVYVPSDYVIVEDEECKDNDND